MSQTIQHCGGVAWLATLIMLCIAESAAAQQNPDGRLAVTAAAEPFLFLIRDPVVYEALRLSPRQREALDALNDELDPGLWSMRNKSAEQIAETTQRAITKARQRLSAVLTAEQGRRLEQIQWWTLATRAFFRDDFVEKLGLSDSQRDSIRETVRQTQEAIQELSQQSDRPRAELENEARSLRSKEQQEVTSALSGSQQQQWLALLGKRIDISQLGRVRFKAPELQVTDEWIHSPPLSLRQLKGKVVALHFYAFA